MTHSIEVGAKSLEGWGWRGLASLASASILTLGSACGGATGDTNGDAASKPDHEAGRATTDTGSPDADSSSPRDAGPGSEGAADAAGFPLLGNYDGFISFINQSDSEDVFGAAFFGNGGAAETCTSTDLGGDCFSFSCVPILDAGAEPSAGVLTLTGGIFGSKGVPLAPVGPGVYGYTEKKAGAPYAPGDVLGVSAAGALVPAFSQSIVAPDCLTNLSPATDGSVLDVSTSKDLNVSWSGGQAGAGVFAAVGALTAGMTTSVSGGCLFNGPDGHGTIPKAALAPLAGLANAVIGVGQYHATVFSVGPRQIFMDATCQRAQSAVLVP